MLPHVIMMIGMILVWDVSTCVARPADVDGWAEESKYGRSEDELNAIDSEPSGLYQGKAAEDSDWKAVFRLAEIVRLSRKFEQVLRKEADEIASESTPVPESPVSERSPPIYGPEKIIDQLHENTGEKQPIYHSALDGWIF